MEWDKRVLIVLEKRKKLSLSNSPSLSLFQPMQHRLMDSFKLTYVTKGKLITHTQEAKGWGTIFSLKPHALILFNHFYLFSKNTKISPIYYFGPPWIFLIGPQIFPISLSIIGHHTTNKLLGFLKYFLLYYYVNHKCFISHYLNWVMI